MKNKNLKEMVVDITDGVLETAVDLVLWMAYYQADVLVNPQGRLVWPHAQMVDKRLAKTNYQSLKNALSHCRSQGLITGAKRKREITLEITEAGKRRLAGILPVYDKKRVWDERVYLITYDIPETKRKDREILRMYLKRIGCAMMQQSVWLTPYNPRKILQDFIKERKLRGTIIISDIGSDGSIGDEDFKSLLAKLYQLDDLNKRYGQLIKKYRRAQPDFFAQINFAFLSILQDDPQLPFKLLSKNWLGDKAYIFYRSYLSKKKS